MKISVITSIILLISTCYANACSKNKQLDYLKVNPSLVHPLDVRRFLHRELIKATKNGNIEYVQRLLQNNANVNAKDHQGMTALIRTAPLGYPEMVELLLQYNADVNAKSYDGTTALTWAVENGRKETVELLLQYNADINAKGRYGLTALLMAIQQGKQGIIELLLQNNADVNAKSDYDGSTPLIMAARYGRLEIVELLLQKNADVNAKTSDGSTALTLAAKNVQRGISHKETVELLLQNKTESRLNATEAEAYWARFRNTMNRHKAIVKVLSEYIADMKNRSNHGFWNYVVFGIKTTYNSIVYKYLSFLL